MNVTELKPLPSYDDINYRLKTDEGLFLLKIFHGEMSANKVRLEEQLNFQYFLKNKVIFQNMVGVGLTLIDFQGHFSTRNKKNSKWRLASIS